MGSSSLVMKKSKVVLNFKLILMVVVAGKIAAVTCKGWIGRNTLTGLDLHTIRCVSDLATVIVG